MGATSLRVPAGVFVAVRRLAILVVLVATVVVIARGSRDSVAHGAAGTGDRPNVVVIMADQWTGSNLGIEGDPNLFIDGKSLTPNLDALANEGVRFRRCLSPTPFCTPGRAALLTGLLPQKVGCARNYRLLDRTMEGFSDILASEGYTTGFIGKWHLDFGIADHEALPGGFVAPGGNRRHGFSFFAGYNTRHAYTQALYYRNSPSPVRPEPQNRYEPEFQTEQARDFIETASDVGDPFLLFLSYGPPHGPHGIDNVPKEYWDLIDPDALIPKPNVPDFTDSKKWFVDPCEDPPRREECWRSYMRGYYAQIAHLDAMVGRILGQLEAVGERENTIVIFTSDHGELGGSHGFYFKGTPHLESIHVPFLMSWPGGFSVPDGSRVYDSWTSLVDIPVTMLSLTGTSFPREVDGRDFGPWLRGDSVRPEPLPIVCAGANLPLQEQRRRSRWFSPPASPEIVNGIGRWRAAHSSNNWVGWLDAEANEMRALYNLEDDPYQMNNLLGMGRIQESRLQVGINDWRYTTFAEQAPQCEFPPHTVRGLVDDAWREDGRAVPAYLEWFPSMNRDGSPTQQYEVYLGYDVPESDDEWPYRWIVGNADRLPIADFIRTARRHYWKVVAIDDQGQRHESPVYWFETAQIGDPTGIEATPGRTAEPSPAVGATDVSVTQALTWEGGLNTRSYRVYIGTTVDPPLLLETPSLLLRGDLEPGTKYYWRVDSVFGRRVTTGPTWSFTTESP